MPQVKEDALISERYNAVRIIAEARQIGNLFDNVPLSSFKFGKYKVYGDAKAVKIPFNQAIKSNLVSTPTQSRLQQFIDIGCTFDTIELLDKHGAISTLAHGVDPNGKKFIYARFSWIEGGPIVFYDDRKMGANVALGNLVTQKNPVSIEQILNEIVHGTYTKVGDKYDVVGNVRVPESITIGNKTVYKLPDIPVYFRNVTQNFSVLRPEWDENKLPDNAPYLYLDVIGKKSLSFLRQINVAESLTLIGAQKLPDLTGINPAFNKELSVSHCKSLKGCPQELETLTVNMAPIPSLEGSPQVIKKRLYVNVFYRSTDGTFSFKGCPKYISGQINIQGMGVIINDPHDFKHLPKTINGDFIFGGFCIPPLMNFDHFPDIQGDFDFTPYIGNYSEVAGVIDYWMDKFMRAGIGDKVAGEVQICNKLIDKKKISREYRNALTQNDHGIDLTF